MVRYRFQKNSTAVITPHKPLNTIKQIVTQVIRQPEEEPKEIPIKVMFRNGKRVEVYKYKL